MQMEEGSFVILSRAGEHGVEHMILPAPSRNGGRILARAVTARAADTGLAGTVQARTYPIAASAED
jgi:hypothetical protein